MTKLTYEDALTLLEAQDIKLYNYQKEMFKLFWDNKDTDYSPLFEEVIIPFKASHRPLEGQQIYISTADMLDNPFAKMVTEYIAENKLLKKERKKMKINYGAHPTHCCKWHGCKYGDPDCPVVTGKVKQVYLCEDCDEDLEYEEYYEYKFKTIAEIKEFKKEREL